MSKIRRTNQGGSIVTFIIVGVILAAGLIGTVYLLKQHGDQVRKEQAIAVSEQQKASEKTTKEATKSESTNKSGTAGSSKDTTTSTSPEAATTDNSDNLPTTGPESVIGEIVGIYLLTLAVTSYASSRRNLKRSL